MKEKQNTATLIEPRSSCPFGKTAADWANVALFALDRAGMSYQQQFEVQRSLEAWLDQDDNGDFVMSPCSSCDYSHGPTTHVINQQQVCKACRALVRS